MRWRRSSSKEGKSHQVAAGAAAYERLGGGGGDKEEEADDEKVPRGHVPILVGRVGDGRGEVMERFVVNVRVLKNPAVAALLDKGAEEFGRSHQQGVLRIPCDADHFRRIVGAAAPKPR